MPGGRHADSKLHWLLLSGFLAFCGCQRGFLGNLLLLFGFYYRFLLCFLDCRVFCLSLCRESGARKGLHHLQDGGFVGTLIPKQLAAPVNENALNLVSAGWHLHVDRCDPNCLPNHLGHLFSRGSCHVVVFLHHGMYLRMCFSRGPIPSG